MVRVKEEVDPDRDISAAGCAATSIKDGPAALFEKLRGYKYSIVTNVHGSRVNQTLMLGLPKNTSVKEQFFEMDRRRDKYPVKPNIVSREDAPYKENVISENIIRIISRRQYCYEMPAWEVYICDHCGYSWRSTEDISIDPKFKRTDEKIANLTENLPVSTLDK